MTIAIIPAGGKATRMMGLPKMLLPTPDGVLLSVLQKRMMQVSPERMVIAATNGNRATLEGYIAPNCHVFDGASATMSEAVLEARLETQNENVIFGMPDTYFEDEYAYLRLTDALDKGADLAVGLFFTRLKQRHKLGMCDVIGGKIVSVVDKPAKTHMIWAWGILAWKPAFWECIHRDDPHVGYGIPRALGAGLNVEAVRMVGGYWDCGTVLEYADLMRHLINQTEYA